MVGLGAAVEALEALEVDERSGGDDDNVGDNDGSANRRRNFCL